jgi:hypothetical protein
MPAQSISPDFRSDSVDSSNQRMSLREGLHPGRFLDRLRRRLVGRLVEKEAASTFIRLIESNHIADLRLIAFITVCCAALFPFFTFALVGWHLWFSDDQKSPFHILELDWSMVAVFAGDVGAVGFPIVGGFWTVAAVILAWCYQSGNARLGIVDLFACEMTTLCRVCTIVNLTESCIGAFENINTDPRVRKGFSHFDSGETYTPVFDDHVTELQVLSVGVVTNITSFYAYWKAMRDAFRHLAGTPPEIDSDGWKAAMRSVIYMQFLAFESARKAVVDLIEFEPNNAENTITILLSELPAFHFLLDKFNPEDVRFKRLNLRRHEYPDIVKSVTDTAAENAKKYPKETDRGELSKHQQDLAAAWDKAVEMLGPLDACYRRAFPEMGKAAA